MMEDAIERLIQEVIVLRESLDELTTVFEHAALNGRISIQLDRLDNPANDAHSRGGNGNNETVELTQKTTSPTEAGSPHPGKLF